VRQKNKDRRWKVFIFLSHIFLSGLFWEKVIPKADRSPDALIVGLNSNQVIPELTPLALSGTPLGYLNKDDRRESPQLVSGGNDGAACLAFPIFA
jgi:hypothetical protein